MEAVFNAFDFDQSQTFKFKDFMLAYTLVEIDDEFMSKKQLELIAKKYCTFSNNKYKPNKKSYKKHLDFMKFRMICIDQNIFSKEKIFGKKFQAYSPHFFRFHSN